MPSVTGSGAPALISTHISHVILMGDRAYKIRRPVKFPFLDLSTVERRRTDCERELRLNRRLAPDVYLGVGRFLGPDVDEPVVVMRRMPADKNLSRIIIEGGDAASPLRAVAHQLAAFHETAEYSERIASCASPEALQRKWSSNLYETQRFIGGPLTPERHEAIGRMADRYLDGRTALLRQRVDQRRVRDAHGDVKADDIFCLDDGPRILDCLEFDDELRSIDVIEDVSSLVMDLEHLGRPDLGLLFQGWYEEFSNDHAPSSLLHHYIAYRALVRAKVACLTSDEGDEGATNQARLLFAMAHTHLSRGAIRLVLVGGLPGTGKTTLSRELSEAQGWIVLSSDAIRKEVTEAPLSGSSAPYGDGIYDPVSKALVYSEMLQRAEYLLSHGESVILDASWSDERHRTTARSLAERTSSCLIELRCRSDPEQAAARMRLRKADPSNLSDATPEVALRMAEEFAAWPEARIVDTSEGISDAIERLFEGPLNGEPLLASSGRS